jgi:hypothetical protein
MGPHLYNAAASESGDWLRAGYEPLSVDEQMVYTEFCMDSGASYAYRDVLRGLRTHLEGLLARADALTSTYSSIVSGLTQGSRVTVVQQQQLKEVQASMVDLKSALLGFLGTSSSAVTIGGIYTTESSGPDVGIAGPATGYSFSNPPRYFNNVVVRSGMNTSHLLVRALDMASAVYSEFYSRRTAGSQAINDAIQAVPRDLPVQADFVAIETLRQAFEDNMESAYFHPGSSSRR